MDDYREYATSITKEKQIPSPSIDLHDVFNVLVEILEELKSMNKQLPCNRKPLTPVRSLPSKGILVGMAEFFYAKGYLSDKQRAVVDNLWQGGAEKFLEDCSNSDMLQILNNDGG